MAAAPRRLIGLAKQPLRNSWLKPTTAVQVSLLASILTTLLITFQFLDPGQEIDRSSGRHMRWTSDAGGLFGGGKGRGGGGGGGGGGIVSSLLQRRNRTAISSSLAGDDDASGKDGNKKDSNAAGQVDPLDDQWATEEHFVPEIVSVDPYHAPAVGGETITIQGYALGAQIVAKKQRVLLEKAKSKTLGRNDEEGGVGAEFDSQKKGQGGEQEEEEEEDEQDARPEEAVYVLIGGTSCSGLEAVEGGDKDSWNQGAAESLRCIVPPGVGIRMNVQVSVHYENGEVKVSRRNKLFSYDDPEVLSVSPTQCPVSGGCTITITGKNFGPPDDRFPVDALVGGISCSQTVKIMDSSLLCAVPRGTPGAKPVIVAVGVGEHHVESRFNRLFAYILTPEEKLDLERDSILEGLSIKFSDDVPLVMHLGEVKRSRPFETYFKDPLTSQTCSYSIPPPLIEVLPAEDLSHHSFDTCAVVGRHSSLYQHDRSVEIDSAGAVIRINLENSEKHPLESFGGTRADFRIIQTAAVKVFLDRAPGNIGRAQLPYPFSKTRLIIWSEYAQDLYVQLIRTFHKTPAFFLSRNFVHSLRAVHGELSRRLDKLGIVDLQALRSQSLQQQQQQLVNKREEDDDDVEEMEEGVRDEAVKPKEQDGARKGEEEGRRRQGGGVVEQDRNLQQAQHRTPSARPNLRSIEVKRENGRGEEGVTVGKEQGAAHHRSTSHTRIKSNQIGKGKGQTERLQRRRIQNVGDITVSKSQNKKWGGFLPQNAAFGQPQSSASENNTRAIDGQVREDNLRQHHTRSLLVQDAAFRQSRSTDNHGDVHDGGAVMDMPTGRPSLSQPVLAGLVVKSLQAESSLNTEINQAATQSVSPREQREPQASRRTTSFSKTDNTNLRHLLDNSDVSGLARFTTPDSDDSLNSSIARMTTAHWTELDDSLSGIKDVEPWSPDDPSPEFYAVMFAIHLCSRVDLYGFPPFSKMDQYYEMASKVLEKTENEDEVSTRRRSRVLLRHRASRGGYRIHGQLNSGGDGSMDKAGGGEKSAEDTGLVRDTIPTGPKLDLEAALIHLLDLHEFVHVHY